MRSFYCRLTMRSVPTCGASGFRAPDARQPGSVENPEAGRRRLSRGVLLERLALLTARQIVALHKKRRKLRSDCRATRRRQACPAAGDHPVAPRTHKMRPCRYVRFCVPARQDYFIPQFPASGSTVQLNLVSAEFANASGKIQVIRSKDVRYCRLRAVTSRPSLTLAATGTAAECRRRRNIGGRGWGSTAAPWGCQRSSDDPRRIW